MSFARLNEPPSVPKLLLFEIGLLGAVKKALVSPLAVVEKPTT